MKKNLIPVVEIEELYTQTRENNSIEEYLDNLHEFFIKFIKIEGNFSQKQQDSYFNTYQQLRVFLQKLKPLEKEHVAAWNDRKKRNEFVVE